MKVFFNKNWYKNRQNLSKVRAFVEMLKINWVPDLGKEEARKQIKIQFTRACITEVFSNFSLVSEILTTSQLMYKITEMKFSCNYDSNLSIF